MKLAQSLGAETQTLTGTDLPAELLRFAKFENVTQIVIGRSRGSFFSELLRRSLPHELVRRTQDIAIHLVTRESEAPAERPWPALARHTAARPAAFSVCDTRRCGGARGRRGADRAHADSQSVDGVPAGCPRDGHEFRHLAGDLRVGAVVPRLQFLLHPAALYVHHRRAVRVAGAGDFSGCRRGQLALWPAACASRRGFRPTACGRCAGCTNSRADCRAWRRSTPSPKARPARSMQASAVRWWCCLTHDDDLALDGGLAAGRCARRCRHDRGALGLQP